MNKYVVTLPNGKEIYLIADDVNSSSDRVTFVTQKELKDKLYGTPITQQMIVAEFYFVNIAGWGIAL